MRCCTGGTLRIHDKIGSKTSRSKVDKGLEGIVWRFMATVIKVGVQHWMNDYLNEGYSVSTRFDGSLYATTNFPYKL